MFDLCLLNSQNKANDITNQSKQKKKKEDFSVGKLIEYQKFLKTTHDQLKTSLDQYQNKINKVLSEGNLDYISAFK